MDYTQTIEREGLTRIVKIKDHPYDLVEFSILQKSYLEDGKILTDHGHTTFYSNQEFKEFFGPIVNELKVRFDADSIQK